MTNRIFMLLYALGVALTIALATGNTNWGGVAFTACIFIVGCIEHAAKQWRDYE